MRPQYSWANSFNSLECGRGELLLHEEKCNVSGIHFRDQPLACFCIRPSLPDHEGIPRLLRHSQRREYPQEFRAYLRNHRRNDRKRALILGFRDSSAKLHLSHQALHSERGGSDRHALDCWALFQAFYLLSHDALHRHHTTHADQTRQTQELNLRGCIGEIERKTSYLLSIRCSSTLMDLSSILPSMGVSKWKAI